MSDVDVTVEITDGQIAFSGERKREAEEKGEEFFRRERGYGSFYRPPSARLEWSCIVPSASDDSGNSTMKHLTPTKSVMRHVLQRARTIAIVGASPSPERHSHAVARYLTHEGYDVIPVRPDLSDVAGLAAFASLADIPGAVDLVVVFRTPSAVATHVEEAAAKGAEAVWLPPGAWSPAADVAAEQHGVTLIKECCVMEEHRHLSQRSGHPGKWGVHVRRRKPTYQDNRVRPEDGGYTPGGGGGHVAGGGGRSVLDEKKMVTGAPSRRRGPMKPRPR